MYLTLKYKPFVYYNAYSLTIYIDHSIYHHEQIPLQITFVFSFMNIVQYFLVFSLLQAIEAARNQNKSQRLRNKLMQHDERIIQIQNY